jgi:hypothetical protein
VIRAFLYFVAFAGVIALLVVIAVNTNQQLDRGKPVPAATTR